MQQKVAWRSVLAISGAPSVMTLGMRGVQVWCVVSLATPTKVSANRE